MMLKIHISLKKGITVESEYTSDVKPCGNAKYRSTDIMKIGIRR
jgi:hypothetical protein